MPSFSCEVYVNVDPAASVEVVQANITALLSLNFFYDFLNLTADHNSISILPVGGYSLYNTPLSSLTHTCTIHSLLCISEIQAQSKMN